MRLDVEDELARQVHQGLEPLAPGPLEIARVGRLGVVRGGVVAPAPALDGVDRPETDRHRGGGAHELAPAHVEPAPPALHLAVLQPHDLPLMRHRLRRQELAVRTWEDVDRESFPLVRPRPLPLDHQRPRTSWICPVAKSPTYMPSGPKVRSSGAACGRNVCGGPELPSGSIGTRTTWWPTGLSPKKLPNSAMKRSPPQKASSGPNSSPFADTWSPSSCSGGVWFGSQSKTPTVFGFCLNRGSFGGAA